MDDDGSGEGPSTDRRVEIRVRKNGRKDKVLVEKSAAEGLPEGWVKELVITKKKGQKIRRDPYFIDPKSGYIFQSFKDASRYVRTGVLGKHARKPKENSQDEDDSGSVRSLSPAGSVENKSPENVLEKEKKFNIYVRNSKRKSLSSLDENSENCKVSLKPRTTSSQAHEVELGNEEEAKDPVEIKRISCSESDITTTSDEHTVEKRVTKSQTEVKNDNNCMLNRKSLSLLNENSENCMVTSKPSSLSSQVRGQEPDKEEECVRKEEAQDITERKHSSGGENDISPQKEKLVEKRVTRSQAKVKKNEDTHKFKRKSEPNSTLPRRASKRLAGIEAKETPELKTRTIACQEPIVEQSDEAVAKKHEGISLDVNPSLDNRTETPLNKVVAEKYEKHSISKPNFALDNREKKELPLVSERNHDAIDIKSKGQFVNKPSAAKKKEMRLESCSTPRTAVAKSYETADGKFEGASSPGAVASLGSSKQMDKGPSVMLAFQNTVAMSDETTGRKFGESSQPNTFLKGHVCVDNNALQTRNGVEKEIAQLGHLAVAKGAGSVLTEKKAHTVTEPPALDSTLADLWKDPCIAFAIKTLTGESLGPLNTAETSTVSRNVVGGGNIRDEQRGVAVLPEVPRDSNNGNENAGSSVALPETDIWNDPCIEFAIKTLTGAIPVGFDQEEDQANSQQPTSPMTKTQVPASKQFNLTHKAV